MKNIAIMIVLLIAGTSILSAQKQDKLLDALQNEMTRSFDELQSQKLPPYFISYYVLESQNTSIRSSFGRIQSNNTNRQRQMDIDVRVGSHDFDNTHIIRGNPSFSMAGSVNKISLPLNEDDLAIRNAVWYGTDKVYKAAIERYEKALTNQAVKVAQEDTSADFSREKPNVDILAWKNIVVGSKPSKLDENNIYLDTANYVAMMRRLSGKFAPHAWLINGSVSFSLEISNKLIINTEGTRLKFSEPIARIFIYMKTKADDGMNLPLHQSYFAFSPEELPSEAAIAQKIDEMIDLLYRLRTAPMAETFTGPAILSGEAAGVFFHEIFGHRVEGHREKDPNSSQTFKNSIGKPVLPDFMNVYFDPSMSHINGNPISGFYNYDDEGVRGQRVETVQNGIFKNFLMARIPIQNFENSNGHGRKQIGYSTVSRQSNLIVEAKKTVSKEELRENLRLEAKRQDKEYGLFFDQVSGGFTFTSRTIPNAFNVTPIIVYKIYADGRPDELVRGVDLIGTPLTTFSSVTMAADDLGIFNGMCGAESGGVPVSAVSPSLLVSQIEVQKKRKSQAKPPIMDAPEYESLSQ